MVISEHKINIKFVLATLSWESLHKRSFHHMPMCLHLANHSFPTPKHKRHFFFTAVVFGSSCCWQFVVIWLCTRVPDCQDSIVWSGRSEKHGGCLSSWKCFLYVGVFSVTLLYAMKTELNMTPLVVQTILPAISHLCQVHTINTKTCCNLAHTG